LSRIVLAFRSVSSGRYAILAALLGFSTSGFHRLCTTKPIGSETNKQYGCQLATMVPWETRHPQTGHHRWRLRGQNLSEGNVSADRTWAALLALVFNEWV
jgi:hypothetical protein